MDALRREAVQGTDLPGQIGRVGSTMMILA
jgi:hypothetical protein